MVGRLVRKLERAKIDKSAGEQFIKFSFTALSATLRAPILDIKEIQLDKAKIETRLVWDDHSMR